MDYWAFCCWTGYSTFFSGSGATTATGYWTKTWVSYSLTGWTWTFFYSTFGTTTSGSCSEVWGCCRSEDLTWEVYSIKVVKVFLSL